jgi:hypothetical protein
MKRSISPRWGSRAATAALLSILATGCPDDGDGAQHVADADHDLAGDGTADVLGDAEGDAGDTGDTGLDAEGDVAGDATTDLLGDADGAGRDVTTGDVTDLGDVAETGDLFGDADLLGDVDAADLLGDAFDAPDALDEPELSEPIGIAEFYVIDDVRDVLARFVTWRTELPVPTTLVLRCEGEPDRTYHADTPRTLHEVLVMGLFEGAVCELEAIAEVGGRRGALTEPLGAVGPLPDWLPPITLEAPHPELVQPGWTLWNLYPERPYGPQSYVIIDEQARIRWYFRYPTGTGSGSAADADPIEGGLLTGKGILRWDGTWDVEYRFQIDHEVVRSPWNEATFFHLSQSRAGCSTNSAEGVVNERNLVDGSAVWSWRICDNYEPHTIPEGVDHWSHLNAIVPVPGTTSFLLSSRFQNNIIRVNRETEAVEWVLGEGGDFVVDEDAHFYRSHAPEFVGENRILLFDNGEPTIRPYSRALELEYTFDEEGLPATAHLVWEYDADEALFSPAKGDVDRMPNGNTLINFPDLNETGPSILVEVTSEGELVWQVSTPPYWAGYRSDRLYDDLPIGWVLTE